MSKIFSGSRTAKVNIMSNMSAEILRSIVSSVFKIKAQSVKLSGEIKPDFTCYRNRCWSSQTTQRTTNLWGFHPEQGFVKLTNLILEGGENFGDGSWRDDSTGKTLADIELVNEFCFFVCHSEGRAYDNCQSWDDWTIYKPANFAQHLAELEKIDIARWEQWLNG